MNINPSSLNLDFNREFCELYSIFRSLEELSLKYNLERKANPKASLLPEHKANADAILKFAKAFVAFSDKYKPHADDVNFTPKTISILDPLNITRCVMNEIYSAMSKVLHFREAFELFAKPTK